MAKVKTVVESKINLQMPSFATYISQLLFEEFQIGETFDMVIKTGSEKHETYCHKIILAASSDFLSKLLDQSDSTSILMPDIRTDVIEYILLFIYTGEVKIPNDTYKEFMEACKLLELKGLTHQDEECPTEMVDLYSLEDTSKSIVKTDTEVDIHIESDYEELEELSPDEENNEEDVPSAYHSKFNISKQNESKVRLKTGFVVGCVPTQAFRISGFEHKSNQSAINKRRLPVALREPQTKITLDDANVIPIREKLIYSVQNAFKDVRITSTDTNFKGTHKVRLIIKDSKLIKGEYNCILCDKVMSVVYSVDKSGKFRQWVNSNLKRHIARVHDIEK